MQLLKQSFWPILLSLLPTEDTRPHLHQDVVCFTIELSDGVVDLVGIGLTPAILINGSFPGPTLNLLVGESVNFIVINNLSEDTAIHFHGISQKETPWEDGVPGVTQHPIPPRATYAYSWQADRPGVYFYHAHRKGQIQDGLYGAIKIKASSEYKRPFHLVSNDTTELEAMMRAEDHLKPLLISDWTQFPYEEVMRLQGLADIDWNCFDAIVVNGVGAQYCPSREMLDDMTSPDLKSILAQEGYPKGLTNKGCVPPVRPFQGDFRLNVSALSPTVYDTCIGGTQKGANYSIAVRSQDRWAALTFINPGGLYPLKVTIDNHAMWVYAVDGRYMHPVLVDQVTVTNGARISVLMRLDQTPGRYMLRISTALMGQILSGYASLDYDGNKTLAHGTVPSMDYAGRPLQDLRIWRDDLVKPFPRIRPARTVDRTFKLFLHKLGRTHGAWEWTLAASHGYNMPEEERKPPLLFLPPGDLPSGEIFIQTEKNEWIDLVIEIESASARHPESMPHPMHKHGNKVFVLGASVGRFVWDNTDEAAAALPDGTFNFEDPPYRDSFYTPSHANESTWIVLRYKTEQPGAWLLHCHIQTHLSGGMAIVLLDGVDYWPNLTRGLAMSNGESFVPLKIMNGVLSIISSVLFGSDGLFARGVH